MTPELTPPTVAVPSLLQTQTAALRRLMPPIEAFGIGGSYGRGTADAAADLDFFIIVSNERFWSCVRAFPHTIEHPLPVTSQGVGRFMSDYGYRIGFILAGNRKVDYFFNSPDTLTPLPLSARIQVIEDRTGWLTSCLASAWAAFDADPREHVRAGVHDCLMEIHDLGKYASRGDLLPMIWRLHTLRRHVLALHHIGTSRDVYAPSSAASRLGSRADNTLDARVDRTVPIKDAASIASAYRALRAIMLEAWDHFAPSGVPTSEQLAAEQQISGDMLDRLDLLAQRQG